MEVWAPIEMSEEEMGVIAERVTSLSESMAIGPEFCKLIKGTLDDHYGPAWHVIVGKNFGCYAVHDKNKFAHFTYKGYTYLIYKTTI
ncbi:MAG: hypothetical protein MJ252_24170 [archaeon]|nr:hypothetical protein [archaeon]